MNNSKYFLIGPMGAGKSTVGKQLARVLGWDFVDIDLEIVKSTGADIECIFDIEGEVGFRTRESKALLRVIASHSKAIVATGGGIVLQAENCIAMSGAGRVIYLSATKEQLYQRTKRDTKRPLLQVADRRAVIDRLFEERDSIYRSVADVICTTQSTSTQQTVASLAAEIGILDR